VQGDVKATFESIAGESQTITKTELKQLLQCMGLDVEVTADQVNNAFEKLDKNNDLSLDWPEFKEWYSSSEAKIWADCDTVFKEIDQNGDGKISRSELVYLLNQILGREPNQEEVDEAWMELLSKATEEELNNEFADDVMCIPQVLFNEWFAKSVFFENRQNAGAQIEKEGNLCFPPWPEENCQAKLLYLVSLPIIILLYLTIPNVTKARFEKFFMVSFIMSIAWIAVFACKWRNFICVLCCVWLVVVGCGCMWSHLFMWFVCVHRFHGVACDSHWLGVPNSICCHGVDFACRWYECTRFAEQYHCCDARKRRHGGFQFHWVQHF
jgi:Ca2+-binding EF-hand superfamily protein